MKDSWVRGPDLNIPRHSHGTLALGDMIYVFAGYNGHKAGHPKCDPSNEDQDNTNGYLNSIEFLNARSALISAKDTCSQWVLASPTMNTRAPRINPLLAYNGPRPNGSQAIAFFGGRDCDGGYPADGFLYMPNHQEESKSHIIRCMAITFKYGGSPNNQVVQGAKLGSAVGLVPDKNEIVCLVASKVEMHEVKLLHVLGPYE